MNTRKLVTLGLTLALALGVAEANAAQTATMPAGTATSAPMAKAGTTPASTAKVGDAKIGTKTGTPKLTSGRSVATPVSASRKMVRAPHRSHLSFVRLRRLHRAHLVRVLARTHVAHAGRKVSAKHA